MKLPVKLQQWLQQPGAALSLGEWQFICDMRKAAAAGVGYGWMQQVCEWEWQEKGVGALGPEYYGARMQLHNVSQTDTLRKDNQESA